MTSIPEIPEQQQPTAAAWMSDETVLDLRHRLAKLVSETQENDKKARDARTYATELEAKAERGRAGIREVEILLAIAGGKAPMPRRDEIDITDDGLGIMFGRLRVAGAPADATPEQLREHAEIMRALYAVAGSVAHKADDAARTAEAVTEVDPAPPAEPAPTTPAVEFRTAPAPAEQPNGHGVGTTWTAYLYAGKDSVTQLGGPMPTDTDAQNIALIHLDAYGITVPEGAKWEAHGSHRQRLTVDDKPLTVERLGRLAEVVVAETEAR